MESIMRVIRQCFGVKALSLCLVSLLVATVSIGRVEAKQRLAFIVGVGDYNDKSGLADLATPVNDIQDIKLALEALPQPFVVDILTDDQAKDKATFDNAFATYLSRIRPGDDVLFYFAGHGYNYNEKNYYLLKTAKSDVAFIKDLTPSEAKELDTNDKKNKRYLDFIKTVAISEDDIESRIAERKPDTIILIADASHSITEISKSASSNPQGVVLPARNTTGAYRLYSASEGQISIDSPEPVYRRTQSKDYRPTSEKTKPRRNSLFARVLISQLKIPGLPFLVIAERVKTKVREQAKKENVDQIPDYNGEDREEEYFFWPLDLTAGLEHICQTANAQLQNLRVGIEIGALGRDYINETFAFLSRCGPFVRQQIRILRAIDAQGLGSFTSDTSQKTDTSQITDPQKICDADGSSPVDADRQPISSGKDVMKLALDVAVGGRDREKNINDINRVVDNCEKAVTLRPLVARFKFNAARANYALATISSGLARTVALKRASALNQLAVDLGYAAAYNGLAAMVENGELYKENGTAPEPPDREAAANLLQRGADLGHVVAQYNLGMAYYFGDLGFGKREGGGSASVSEKSREPKAFKYLSAASEKSYVPAMIMTAVLLHDGKGVPRNRERAIDLLKSAAYAGSWQAMYYLGWIYARERDTLSQAVMWYARAAEAGHVVSQRSLADMLAKGEGVPAPQPDAAGRYYRLAAYGGSPRAMSALGNLLRDRKIPFRPVADRRPDGGALEIHDIYLNAFAVGDAEAGLSLARLYRSGFPTEQGSEAIPKDPERAIDLLYKTIERVHQVDPESADADPRVAADAAFELLSMYDNGEAKRKDGTTLLSDDQVQQLRQEYGDGGRKGYILVAGIGKVACGENSSGVEDQWLMVWDWDHEEPTTENQLRWLERYYNCAEHEISKAKDNNKNEPKPEDTGFTKGFREKIAQQYRAARDDFKRNGAKAKSFYDRMAELVTPKK